jgi:tripartite-type tricarboxylate transporter receptor subunit TctC
MITRRHLLTGSAASVVFSAAGLPPRAAAQSRLTTAHILTGYTPGLPDAVARLIADQMKDYAASIVIETRPGASGRVAVEAVKAGEAD